LLRLAGSLSIGITLSVYPGEFDPEDFTWKADEKADRDP
jgi:hypothetical protein